MFLLRLALVLLGGLLSFTASASTPADDMVTVEGFARLFEEEIPLSNALISVEEYDWTPGLPLPATPLQRFSINADSEGRFHTQVTRNRWFRLTLHGGKPRSYKEARDAWIQHVSILNALMEVDTIDDMVETLLASKISEWIENRLLNYISMDSSLMLADKDYLSSTHEISFQVPLQVTYDLMKFLGNSVYGTTFDPSQCHLAVTALAPDYSQEPEYHTEQSLSKHCSVPPHFVNGSFTVAQTLKDCPHGAKDVTFTSTPSSELIHYLGIKSSCKTDLLAAGLSSTTRDGGALLANIKPSVNIGYLDAWQDGSFYLGRHYFICSPGSVINISPPQGPVGVKDESHWVAQEGQTDIRVAYGLMRFVDHLFPEINSATRTVVDTTVVSLEMLWMCLWSRTALLRSRKYLGW